MTMITTSRIFSKYPSFLQTKTYLHDTSVLQFFKSSEEHASYKGPVNEDDDKENGDNDDDDDDDAKAHPNNKDEHCSSRMAAP